MHAKTRILFTNIGISVFAVFAVLLAAELLVRLFADENSYKFYDASDNWELDDSLGWRNKANYSLENSVNGKTVRFSTNQDGLRPASVQAIKKQQNKRLLLIGNSTVVGRSVREQESLHYFLDSLLNLGEQHFEVINAGVEGYASDQAFLQLKRLIQKYDPDYVTYGFCNNDLFANLKKNDAGLNKPYFEFLNGNYILRLPAKNNEIKQLGKKNIVEQVLQNSALFGLLRPGIYQLRVLLVKDQQKVEGIDPEVYLHREKFPDEFNLLSHIVLEMSRLCKENHAKFFLYCHPGLKSVWQPYRSSLGIQAPPSFCEDALSEIAQTDSVPFIKMVDDFWQNQDKGPFHLLPFDGHCNGNGYWLQAMVIAREINRSENAPAPFPQGH